MPKQSLSGTLDEQCEFLYQLGCQKMEQGNYTGAVHAFGEIVKYAPDFRDTAELLALAKRRKAEQRFLIVTAFVGAVVAIGAGGLVGLGNDLLLMTFALVGAGIGYMIGVLVNSRRKGRSA